MIKKIKSIWDDILDDPSEIAICEAKSIIMDKIIDLINENNFTQQQAAQLMGVTQPRISDIKRGKISKFTIDALLGVLAKIGVRVDITFDDEQNEDHQGFVDWAAFAQPLVERSYADNYPVQHVKMHSNSNREMSHECELAA